MAKVKKGTKACPFCGKVDTLRLMTDQELNNTTLSGLVNWTVVCDASDQGGMGGCGASGGFSLTKKGALMNWDMRA